MAVLVLQIPPRPRPPAPAPTDFAYLLSDDGRNVAAQGRAVPALLPKAGRVIALVADADIAWHRITLPKAPPARLRAALGGLMEEALLDDDDTLQLALAPQPVAGQPTWVAVLHKPWLRSVLGTLDAAGVRLEALRPASMPGGPACGHFSAAGDGAGVGVAGADGTPLQLVLSGPDGVSALRLAGTLPRALVQARIDAGGTTWTATPDAATAAGDWLGAPLSVCTEAERQLQAAASAWELRQFELAPRSRGLRALGDATRRLAGPAWRPVRIGLVALAALQLVGLNAWAWQQQRTITARKAAADQLLRSTHPQVRAVLDAPLQMERETALLRAAAGRAGDGDLEPLLGAAAAAWPDGGGPAPSLRYEPGRLAVGTAGWSDGQLAQFGDRLRADGWSFSAADGRATLTRGGGR